MKLVLGVVDVPYANPPAGPHAKKSPPQVSTSDVAGWLENRYHPMEIFFRENEEKIAEQVTDSLAGTLENLLAGAPADTTDPLADAASAIGAEFRDFITQDRLAQLGYPGLPTKAALEGLSSRFKKKKGAGPRVSLIDTGNYVNSAKCWFDDE